MNPPIVLLTDFGMRDHYVASMKGVILSIHPEAQIVDLTHEVEAQSIQQAALLLENSFSYFPAGTIFVCVVDPEVGTKRKILCVKTKKYYFLAPDNGLLTLALKDQKGVVIHSVENPKFFLNQTPSSTFHGRDIFSPVAARLAQKDIFNALGPKIVKMRLLDLPRIKKTKKGLQGEILYFDHFGNAITNIKEQDASPEFWKKAKAQVKELQLGKLHLNYTSRGTGLLTALLNSSSRLEIAVPGGSAKETAGLEVGDTITVHCEESRRDDEAI